MPEIETITVDTPKVACDGGTLGHPRVWLNLRPRGEAECPYCGRRYVLAEGADVGGAH